MLASLTKLNAMLCDYNIQHDPQPPSFCDCKFGPQSADEPGGVGEHTGCPELRVTRDLLKRMTDEQFDQLLARTRWGPETPKRF